MEKTYKILEDPKPMTINEIREQFKGWWVYIITWTLQCARHHRTIQ